MNWYYNRVSLIGMIMTILLILDCCSSFNKANPGRVGCRLIMTEADGQGSLVEGIAALISRSGRPSPITLPRKRMELPFAVQLMRSSYNTADELDFVAMVIESFTITFHHETL